MCFTKSSKIFDFFAFNLISFNGYFLQTACVQSTQYSKNAVKGGYEN